MQGGKRTPVDALQVRDSTAVEVQFRPPEVVSYPVVPASALLYRRNADPCCSYIGLGVLRGSSPSPDTTAPLDGIRDSR